MNKVTRLSVLVLFCVSFAASSLFAGSKVSTYMGDVDVQKRGTSSWQSVSANMTLGAGDIIKTGSDGFCEIHDNQNVITVQANSKLKIDGTRVGENKETQSGVSLFLGSIKLKIIKLGDGEDYNVNAPAMVAAIRGTEFIVASGHDGKALVQVTEGAVALRGNTKEVMVKANQQSEVPLGGDPEKVKTMSRQNWREWLDQSSQNLSQNPLPVFQGALSKLRILDKEIQDLEAIQKANAEEAARYRAEALRFQERGNDEQFQKYLNMQRDSERKANSSRNKAFYKASRIDFVFQFIMESYQKVDNKKSVSSPLSEITSIRTKYFVKYIEPIQKEAELRERIRRERERRRNR